MSQTEFEREAAKLGRNDSGAPVRAPRRTPLTQILEQAQRQTELLERIADHLAPRAVTSTLRDDDELTCVNAVLPSETEQGPTDWVQPVRGRTLSETNDSVIPRNLAELVRINGQTDLLAGYVARSTRAAFDRGVVSAEKAAGGVIERLRGELNTARTKLADIQGAVILFNTRVHQFDTTWDRIEEVLGR